MKNIKIIGLAIVTLILITMTGCADESNLTPKQILTNQLVYELQHCNSQFSSDIQSFDYCEKILVITKELIDQGFFDDEQEQIHYESEKELNSTSNVVDDEIDLFRNDILGDI